MQIDMIVFRVACVLSNIIRTRNILLSKIWYRHVVIADIMDLTTDQVKLWIIERPQGSLYWETMPGADPRLGMKLHIAFRRREDAVMFRLRAM